MPVFDLSQEDAAGHTEGDQQFTQQRLFRGRLATGKGEVAQKFHPLAQGANASRVAGRSRRIDWARPVNSFVSP
ncbi:MAG: hypothetical protein Tsb0017_03990 [Geothermobacteraceae bacterium]